MSPSVVVIRSLMTFFLRQGAAAVVYRLRGSFDIGCGSALSLHFHTPSSALSLGAHPWGLIVPCFMRHPLGAHYPFANLSVICLYLCPCCAGLPPRPSGQLRVARRCRTLPRASSRRSDWCCCHAHLASVSSVSTCRACVSGPPRQSFRGHTFSSHHRPRWCTGVSLKCPSMSPLPFPCTSPFDSRSLRSAILSFILPALCPASHAALSPFARWMMGAVGFPLRCSGSLVEYRDI